MHSQSSASTAHHVTLDCLSGAAGHLRKNWGDYGYRLGIVASSLFGGGLFEATHSDGSRFQFTVDRYGNVVEGP